jgi:hypothetical protein
MRRWSPLLFAACFALAGCTDPYEKQDDGVDGDDGAGDPCTAGVDGCPCPEDARAGEGGCESLDSILFDIQMSGSGSYEVGVPFPHGAWCLTGDDWLEGMQETKALEEFTVRDVDRGKVLWLKGRDTSKYTARIELNNRTECNTLRADPWSVDPDPAEDTLDVQSQQGVTFTIFVRTVHGPCDDNEAADQPRSVRVQQFEGEASGGWATIPEKFDQTNCQ